MKENKIPLLRGWLKAGGVKAPSHYGEGVGGEAL